MIGPARDLPDGATLFRVGTLNLPSLRLESSDWAAEEGWVHLSLWAPGIQPAPYYEVSRRSPEPLWENPENPVFIGMIGIVVPGAAVCVYDA